MVWEEMIREDPNKGSLDIRKEAYFIYTKLLVHQFDENGFTFLFRQTDKPIPQGQAIWWIGFISMNFQRF